MVLGCSILTSHFNAPFCVFVCVCVWSVCMHT